MDKSKWQLEPTLTSDGRPWWELCYYCKGQIDFVKDSKSSWKRLGGVGSKLVRHTKCYSEVK
jgi:hypothetical protein